MKMAGNMVNIVKFVYVMIIFLSLFIVEATDVEAAAKPVIPKCKKAADCPPTLCQYPYLVSSFQRLFHVSISVNVHRSCVYILIL
ncbi:unnamed protein product [Trifolium pratense]|uniref:Uncharacterized protein n=1 Tax=Trifolium pratense TaxID=57577 RepID=A0ACB0LK13_TRIPR|nr:unnamed protein product [Trifolium pratense]